MPDPFRTREYLLKKKQKKRGGSLPSANVYANTQKIFVTLPTLSRRTGEERRLLQVLFLDYHQTKTLNNADNLFSKQKFEHKVGNKTERKTSTGIHNQSTVGLRFKTAIPTTWRSWCVGDSRHMVDSQDAGFDSRWGCAVFFRLIRL